MKNERSRKNERNRERERHTFYADVMHKSNPTGFLFQKLTIRQRDKRAIKMLQTLNEFEQINKMFRAEEE